MASEIQSLVAQREELVRQILALNNAENDLAQSQQQLHQTKQQQRQLSKSIPQVQQSVGKLTESIETERKKPLFFGKQGRRRGLLFRNDEKIHDIEAELSGEVSKLQSQQTQLETVSLQIQELSSKQQRLAGDVKRKCALNDQAASLYDTVVGKVRSVRLTTLENDERNVQALCTELALQMDQVKQALGLYEQSKQLQQRASGANFGAVVFDGPMERMAQLQRDRMMNEAVLPAEQGSALLQATFQSINPALRSRYPELMAQVGLVPVASLAVGNFGRDVAVGLLFGDVGDAMNQIGHARKLRENKEAIERCMRISMHQLQLMGAVHQCLKGDIRVIQGQREQERQLLFDAAASGASPIGAADGALADVSNRMPNLSVGNDTTAVLGKSRKCVVKRDHYVDETDAHFAQFQILSVPKGATVIVEHGDLQNGRGGVMKDYCGVCYNGRHGNVSKFVLAMQGEKGPEEGSNAAWDAPPPAYEAPPTIVDAVPV